MMISGLPVSPKLGVDKDDDFIEKSNNLLSALPVMVEQINSVLEIFNPQIVYIQTNYNNISSIQTVATNITNVNYFKTNYPAFIDNFNTFIKKADETMTKIDTIYEDLDYLNKIEVAKKEYQKIFILNSLTNASNKFSEIEKMVDKTKEFIEGIQ